MSAIVDKLLYASIAFTTECLHSDSYPQFCVYCHNKIQSTTWADVVVSDDITLHYITLHRNF